MTALLFVDLKTTSLLADLTVLEAAWCITDLDGAQRTSLRSRYCEIGPGGKSDVPTLTRAGWTCEKDTNSVPKLMAAESGLYDDWLACPQRSRVSSGAELQRLILDDLAAVCDQGDSAPARDPEYVHLAGSGVARFDVAVLQQHCWMVTPRPGDKQPTHYRPVDVSIIQTGLLGNNHEAALINWLAANHGESLLDIKLGTAPEYAYGDDAVKAWLLDGAGRHRAAPDAARAIVVQRALWRWAADLRATLGG